MALINKLLIATTSTLIIATSCKKFEKVDFKEAWNPSLAIPLAYTKFGVYDILAKQDSSDLIVSNQETGELSLNYSNTLVSVDAKEFIGDINLSKNLSYNLADLNISPQINYNGQANSFRNEIIDFTSTQGQELDRINFNSGTLNLEFSTQLRQDVMLTLTFPELTRNGNPITENILLEFNGTIPNSGSITVDLTNVFGDFTLNNTDHNKLRVQVQTTIIGNGTQDITGGEFLNVNINSVALNFKNIEGYFGQNSLLNNADSVLLKIFSKTDQQGNFILSNPKINFIITNSFGIPVELGLNNLKTIQAFDGGLTFPLIGFPTPIDILAPNSLGESTIQSIELNNNNTQNLNSIISPTPKYFYYETNAIPNPDGKTGIPNFVDESSQLEIRAEVNMPLEGYAYGFYVQDTTDFNLNQDTELIESIMFRLITDSYFPVNLDIQITATDNNFNPLFNLFETSSKNFIEGAAVDSDGKVLNNVHKVNDITMSQDKIDKIKYVKKLIIRAEASSTGYNENNPGASTTVKFYDFYTLGLQLSMQLKIK